MRCRALLPLPLVLSAGMAAAACSDGGGADAYALGQRLALQGLETRAREAVAARHATCYVLGHREGRLMRMLAVQPVPPRKAAPVRPRRG
ncbi:hypothetical protein [Mangrovicoccus algicola]|uniref:Uncharacterized protein n=1 Tax=Mangrovicoccus algicola TaxID=2771008 RepID=A0A8J6Z3D2_9RHOB|nr:hypothetical protein [Mangrovicoccus algicola]MBE3636699.1 hypothetical protein [Mangrovicoccus algicola]